MQNKRELFMTESTEQDQTKLSDKEKKTASRDAAVRKYSLCPICSSRLHFSYQTDFGMNTTHETVKCPECAIRIRRVLHRLQ